MKLFSFIQQHKQIPNMISLTYFTSYTNLYSNQKITSQCLSSAHFSELQNHFQIKITLVVIVDLIYIRPKILYLLGLVKLHKLPCFINMVSLGVSSPTRKSPPSPICPFPNHFKSQDPPSTIFYQSHKIAEGVKNSTSSPYPIQRKNKWIHIWL